MTAYRGGLNTNGTNAEDGEVALKMTNQMPVAIELNMKNRIVMVAEALTGWLSSDKISQGFNISMTYSDKQKVQITENGEVKEVEKYWLDISQNQQKSIYQSEEEIYDNIGLGIVEEGPTNSKTYMFTGLAPYIQQFPSGETVILYNKYYQDENGAWNQYPTLRIGDTEANFTDSEEFRYDKDAGYGFASISVVSPHCLLLTTSATYTENEKEKHYIGIYPMQLNHTIDANWHSNIDFLNKEISWNKNKDALFIGSESQAQMTIQTAYDESNIYFLVNRLDKSLTDEDTVELYVNTNAENNTSSKIVLDKNGVKEFNGDTNIANYGIQSSEYVNDTKDEEGGYQVLVAIPKKALGEVKENIKVNAILNNRDEGTEETIIDTFTNINMDDTTTWNTVNLIKEEIEITALPNKTEYIQNYEKLDLNGAKIKVKYNENEFDIVDVTPEMVTGFDNSKLGTQTLTVTYHGQTDIFNVTIKIKETPNNSNTNIYTTDENEQDKTVANKVLPTTGVRNAIITIIILFIIISICMFYKMKKHKGIR